MIEFAIVFIQLRTLCLECIENMQRITGSSLYLLRLQEIMQREYSDIPPEDIAAIEKVISWVHSFLCNSHPDLGRGGPVCPFTQPSMRQNMFWLSVCNENVATSEQMLDAMMRLKQAFLNIQSTYEEDSQYYLTVLMLFPALSSQDELQIISVLKEQLKPDFIREGLMIGLFYEAYQKPGLWNPNFKPFQSPVPMLVIRKIVPSDLYFSRNKPEYVQAYLDNFAPQIPIKIRKWIAELIHKEALSRLSVKTDQSCEISSDT